MIHTALLRDAEMVELLYVSAQEFGFRKTGILEIPYNAKRLEEWMLLKNTHQTPWIRKAYAN